METTVIAQLAMESLTSAPPATVRAPAPADEVTATRFAEMMKPVQPSDDPAPAAGAARAAGTDPARPATLGESILEGMNHLSHDFDETRRAVRASLDPGHAMTFSDALRLQLTLTELSIQNELVGKAISRSTQNIDQLVKMQ
jgi:type III secretion protein I